MARLPTPQIPWRFRVNVSASGADALIHRQMLLFEIKQTMIGNATYTDGQGAVATLSTPWTVLASSDAASAVLADRWDAFTDLVWDTNGTAHAWAVLEHPNLFGAGLPGQVLFDCSQADAAQNNAAMGVFFSRAGFGLGAPTTTNRPTAADEVTVLAADGRAVGIPRSPWQGPVLNDGPHRVGRLHVMISDDGRYVRWAIYRSVAGDPDACVGVGDLFPVPDYDLVSEWDMPALMQVWSLGTDTECNTWALARSDGSMTYKGRDTLAIGAFEANLQSWQSTVADTSSVDLGAIGFFGAGSIGLAPIGLAGVAPLVGSFAAIPDMWWGRTATRNEQLPADGSRQFSQIGDRLYPWDRTVMLVS